MECADKLCDGTGYCRSIGSSTIFADQNTFLLTWREEQCNSVLNWGSKNFSVYLPESLRVVNDIYLRIQLPALASTTYRKYPGLFAIKTIRLLSQGQEVYSCDYMQHMADHLQQYTEEELKDFAKIYLGGENAHEMSCYRFSFQTVLLSAESQRICEDTAFSHVIWAPTVWRSRSR